MIKNPSIGNPLKLKSGEGKTLVKRDHNWSNNQLSDALIHAIFKAEFKMAISLLMNFLLFSIIQQSAIWYALRCKSDLWKTYLLSS